MKKSKIIVSVFFTIAIILTMVLTILMTLDFNFRNLNYVDFVFSIFLWCAGRMIYFPIGTDLGYKDVNVEKLVISINNYRDTIFKEKINKEFEKKIDAQNEIEKRLAYSNFLDYKLSVAKRKNKKFLKWKKKKEEFLDNPQFNIKNIKIKYDKIDIATILAFGAKERTNGKKYKINVGQEGVNESILSFIFSVSFSLLSAISSVGQYGFTLMALFTFLLKLLSFAWGCFCGLKLGKKIITENKYAVLINLASKTNEFITEIHNEQHISSPSTTSTTI